MSADEKIKQIIQTTARGRQDSYEQAVSSLSEHDRRIVAAHMGFVQLHMRLCSIAEIMRQNKMPATVERDGSRIELVAQSRSAACICALKDDTIQIQLLGGVVADAIFDYHSEWAPPPGSPDATTLWASLEDVAIKITRHVAGA